MHVWVAVCTNEYNECIALQGIIIIIIITIIILLAWSL